MTRNHSQASNVSTPSLEQVAEYLGIRLHAVETGNARSGDHVTYPPTYRPAAAAVSASLQRLQRLVDDAEGGVWRAGSEISAISSGIPIPDWVIEANDLVRLVASKNTPPDSARWAVFDAIEKEILSAAYVSPQLVQTSNAILKREEVLEARKSLLQRRLAARPKVENVSCENASHRYMKGLFLWSTEKEAEGEHAQHAHFTPNQFQRDILALLQNGPLTTRQLETQLQCGRTRISSKSYRGGMQELITHGLVANKRPDGYHLTK